ncbi:hypothetical protein KY290_005042 [Solanum tuberosum]|uniref:Uncharacterized protein n=1 Tax=Solanum tuberosum TaxID=4113 RepID=A0ABQ7WCZ5_SOLTU|nr:hypothetical protein KY290_005042 [Solanum tuberosum]
MSQEEDVAYCLMMLSRDKWTKKRIEVIEDDDEEEEERKNFRVVKMKKTRTREYFHQDKLLVGTRDHMLLLQKIQCY